MKKKKIEIESIGVEIQGEMFYLTMDEMRALNSYFEGLRSIFGQRLENNSFDPTETEKITYVDLQSYTKSIH